MEASKNDRLVKKFTALEDKTWFPQELLELVKAVCRLQGEVKASLAVSVDPALVCGDLEHRQGPAAGQGAIPRRCGGVREAFPRYPGSGGIPAAAPHDCAACPG